MNPPQRLWVDAFLAPINRPRYKVPTRSMVEAYRDIVPQQLADSAICEFGYRFHSVARCASASLIMPSFCMQST